MAIRRLIGSIQNYAWGSHSTLAIHQGRPAPTAAPEAELWFGAHTQAPSMLEVDGENYRLDAYLQSHQAEELGSNVAAKFGKLPFLLKLLAVERPLSIQVHPSPEQAKAGFISERNQGIAVDDAQANYRDDWPKPELLCPLTPFEALCGFRPTEELVSELRAFGGECFASAARILASSGSSGEGLREVTSTWLAAPGPEKARLYESAIQALSRAEGAAKETASFALGLANSYPGDMGILVALLLRRWSLQPGQGLFVPAGILHAYLRGFAVEVMASSDNVLRGGLTPKHVDVPEVLKLVDFAAEPLRLAPIEELGPLEMAFHTDTPQFRLSNIEVRPHESYCARPRIGPELLLCVEGEMELVGVRGSSLRLSRGQCAWVSAMEDVYCVAGSGRAARVQVGA